MAWTHYTFGRTLKNPAPRFHPEPPKSAVARSLTDLLEESTGLARAGAAAVCWDGQIAAVVQVHIAGTDHEGRPRSEVRIREKEADANAFAGSCLALFHTRPIESEAEWDHATLEIADRGHQRLAAPTLSALSQLWSSAPAPLAAVKGPALGAREEAADICLVIRAVLALSGLPPPVVVANSMRSFSSLWASDKWWTLLVASDGPTDTVPDRYEAALKFIQEHPRGFSELEEYGEKLLEPPSLDRLSRAIFIAQTVDDAIRRSDGGPTFVELPRLIDAQQRTEGRLPPRVWEVIRGRMHMITASDRYVADPELESQVQGFVGERHEVTLEIGSSSIHGLSQVRDLLGDRVGEQVRMAIEKRLPAEDAIMSASKTVGQQSNHVVKLRLQRDPAQVIAEIRALPAHAPRRAELSDLACELLEGETPLDLYITAKRPPSDRVAGGLIKLAPRWSGPPEALELPVNRLDAEWLVANGETILMTARRVGADAFSFWVPLLVEAALRSVSTSPRLIEALLRTNQVGLDDSAALIRHSSTATEFVRNRTLELWTSGHRLIGLENWLPRPTKPVLDDVWERLPEPIDDKPPAAATYIDPLASLLWVYAARIRYSRDALRWAEEIGAAVQGSSDVMSVRALLHHHATWLPFARDLWLAGHGRLLDGVPFDIAHLEYIAKDVQATGVVEESRLLAPGTPDAMTELAAERLIPWLRAAGWTSDFSDEGGSAIEAVVSAWQSNDEGNRRAVSRFAWSMVAAKCPQPRRVWLERAWNVWAAKQAGETPVQFLRSFPAYLQVELVGLGHVSLAEVEIMAKTSLPLINVFLVRSSGNFEAAVLYEIPVASTWSLVIALPPGVELPEEVVNAAGEQTEVLAMAATALDEMAMPFCLGLWNNNTLAWKEGRNAWVSSDGLVVCLNTDREPAWYEPMRAGFGSEPTQRMLSVAAATDAPDEMLSAVPRARVLRGTGVGGPSFDLLGGRRWALGAIIAVVVLVFGAVVYSQMGSSSDEPVEPPERERNGHPSAAEASPEAAAPCPFQVDATCDLLKPGFAGASVYCEHALAEASPYERLLADPSKGPRCLTRLRDPKARLREYQDRHQGDAADFRRMVAEVNATACEAWVDRGCTEDDCARLTEDVQAALVDVLAKRFARELHLTSADRAVPSLGETMPYDLRDPSTKTARAWIKQAMPVSCSWQIITGVRPQLNEATEGIAEDFDRLSKKLPAHDEALADLRTP